MTEEEVSQVVTLNLTLLPISSHQTTSRCLMPLGNCCCLTLMSRVEGEKRKGIRHGTSRVMMMVMIIPSSVEGRERHSEEAVDKGDALGKRGENLKGKEGQKMYQSMREEGRRVHHTHNSHKAFSRC